MIDSCAPQNSGGWGLGAEPGETGTGTDRLRCTRVEEDCWRGSLARAPLVNCGINTVQTVSTIKNLQQLHLPL